MANAGDCKYLGKCEITTTYGKYSPFCDGDGVPLCQDTSFDGWPNYPPQFKTVRCHDFECVDKIKNNKKPLGKEK